MHDCPVCGYRRMRAPPEHFNICSCCGTEFGNDDFDTSHEELRNRWISLGAPWFSTAVTPDENWNPYRQLLDSGFGIKIRGDSAEASSSVSIEPFPTTFS